MKLSFGMIFSIILIVIFIAFAFYAIKAFLDMQKTAQIGKFGDDLQKDVDKMWRGTKGSEEYTYILPKEIDEVCFVEGMNNLVIETDAFVKSFSIEHINIDKILNGDEEFCIDNDKGKLKLTIKKDWRDNLVTIER